MGTYAYIALPELQRQVPGYTPNLALVQFQPGADGDRVRQRLAALPGVDLVANTEGLAQVAEQFMGLFYAFVGAMLVLGGVHWPSRYSLVRSRSI
ncbi:MAG: hypothetical protein ACYC4L_03995 [Chloroflexota bacterium]